MTDTLADSIRRLEAAQTRTDGSWPMSPTSSARRVTRLVAEASILREHLGRDATETRRTAELPRRRRRAAARSWSRSSWSCRASTPTPRRRLEQVDLGKLIESVRVSAFAEGHFAPPAKPVDHRRRPAPAGTVSSATSSTTPASTRAIRTSRIRAGREGRGRASPCVGSRPRCARGPPRHDLRPVHEGRPVAVGAARGSGWRSPPSTPR
jgi:hypothetical protein